MSDPHDEPGKQKVWQVLYEQVTGATAPGQHADDRPGADPNAQRAGHEPDRFDVRGILIVPVFVVVATGLAYLVVTGAFNLIGPFRDHTDPTANPQAVALNNAPFNERVARVNEGGGTAPASAVGKQPRLEYVKKLELDRQTMRGERTDPPFLRSFPERADGNPPEYRPEDLRAENYIHPETNTRVLAEYAPVADGKASRIPIDQAMRLLVQGNRLKAKAEAAAPAAGTSMAPKISNGGRSLTSGPIRPNRAPVDEAVPAKERPKQEQPKADPKDEKKEPAKDAAKGPAKKDEKKDDKK